MAQLEREGDTFAQRSMYETLLKHLVPLDQRPTLPYRFNRDTEVDWNILAPWRRH